jgi:hypothetical protein
VAEASAAVQTGPITIVGNRAIWGSVEMGASLTMYAQTVTLDSTPNFTSYFLGVARGAAAVVTSNTYVGTATGKSYDITTNGVLIKGGDTLPGNVAGTTSTGGQVT